MKERQRSSKPSETSRNQFLTPRRPSPPGPPTTSIAKNTAAKREQSPESSTSSRSRKRISLPRLQAQSTLTQIDFVTQRTPSNDGQLDYIDENDHRGDTQSAHE